MLDHLLSMIETQKVIAICRKIYGSDLLTIADALLQGGIHLIEVTFDQKDADCLQKTSRAIAALKTRFPNMQVGAGTVLTKEQVSAAADSGATFIISPNTSPNVIEFTKSRGLVSIPGAMTPSEILLAHDAGADFVKLFPAAALGIPYAKSILSPISHVRLIATGGIGVDNLEQFLAAGFAGAGVGGSLCDTKLIAAGKCGALTSLARALMDIVEKSNS